MGSGIAQVAAAAGHNVVIADANAGAAEKARANIGKGLDGLVAKGKTTRAAADALIERIHFVHKLAGANLSAFASCGLVIEAIIEDAGAKRTLFAQLEEVVDVA